MYDKSQMLLFLLLIVASSGEDTHPSCQSGCFYDSPESCPSPNQPFRCRISPICSNAVICCNLTNDNIFEELRNINNESNQQYRALHIMQSSFDSFNNNMTGWCRFVESFAVTNGEMRSFDTEFPRHIKTLTCLNLTSNGITELNNSLKRITNLRMLDVSRNKLKKLPAFGSNQNITLDISNNSFQCEKLQEIMKSKAELHYKNGNITWCAQPNNNTWFNVSVYLGLYEIERMNEIETVCPKNCTCTVHRVDVRPEHKLQSSISFAINCAEKQLTALPSPLPDRTIALNVSGNNLEVDTKELLLSKALKFIEFAINILNNARFRRGIESKVLVKYVLNYQNGFTENFQSADAIQIDYKQIVRLLKNTNCIIIVKYCVHILLRYVKASINKKVFVGNIQSEYLLKIVTTIAELANILSTSKDFESHYIIDEILCFVKNLLDFISDIKLTGYQYQIYQLVENLIIVFKTNDEVQKFILNNIYEKLLAVTAYIKKKNSMLSGTHMEGLMHYATIFKIVLQHRFANNKSNILCATFNSFYSEDLKYKDIESLAPIKNDTSYKDLREFYAYHNNISDILPLEGSNFISNFVALNLRYNNIKSFPAYMFMNTFDRNNNIRTVRLGQNRIICNCDTARILKVWLGMAKRIEDSEEIFCEGTGKQVVALDVTEMCKNELGSKSWVDYIYFVIAAEIALLATLIAKVSYDYWVFKTKGYLPWPASKMPKLPCDWLCE